MVSEEEIKKLAFSFWEQEGCPQGKDVEHYFRARATLEQQEARRTSGTRPQTSSTETIPSLRPEQLPEPPAKKRARVRSKKA